MRNGSAIGYALVFLALAGFFGWVMWQMGMAGGSLGVLARMGLGSIGVMIAAAVIYVLLRGVERATGERRPAEEG